MPTTRTYATDRSIEIRPVPIDVTSAPTKFDSANITRQVLTPAKVRYGTAPLKPFLPNAMKVMMNGMMSTPNIWKRPTIAAFCATVASPASTSAAPPLMVVRPAPPHEAGVASPSSAMATAVTGSNPSATRNGAAMAAGAPAPAAPSRKMGIIMPITMTCTRRSSLMRAMVAFTSSIAPVSRRRFRITNAPNTISTILKPSLTPFQTSGSNAATFSANVAPVTLK